jgi:putative ABC transport system ATP-binding protein
MIEIKDLEKQFQNETEIKYNDITFEDGKSYMLLGASGCGKSTLLNMIAGVLTPTKGKIIIDGVTMSDATQRKKDKFRIQKIGYIFQDFKLINDMTVADNIGILRLEGVDVSGMDEVLRELGIYEKKKAKIKHLSGGQKQRVAIARALVKKPDIILADEPTGNLNFAIGEQVIKALTEISKGKTLIAVTHDERLAKYFDYVINMDEMTSGISDIVSPKEVDALVALAADLLSASLERAFAVRDANFE